jgi:hypothetical protein
MPEGIGPQRHRQHAQRNSRPCGLCLRRKTRCIIESSLTSCSVCRQRRSECNSREEAPRSYIPGVVEGLPSTPLVLPPPSPHDVLNSQQLSASTGSTVADFNSSHPRPGDTIEQDQGDDPSQSAAWRGVLALNREKFAELYGLGSDMGPILMI